MTAAGCLSNADVVKHFYAAVGRKDAAAIEALVQGTFDPDVVLSLPGSLPYGGEHRGASRLARMFTTMAASSRPVGPTDLLLTDLVEDRQTIVASITFTYVAPGREATLPMTALEVWTFHEHRVTQIHAYYWDTAACVAALRDSENT